MNTDLEKSLLTRLENINSIVNGTPEDPWAPQDPYRVATVMIANVRDEIREFRNSIPVRSTSGIVPSRDVSRLRTDTVLDLANSLHVELQDSGFCVCGEPWTSERCAEYRRIVEYSKTL